MKKTSIILLCFLALVSCDKKRPAVVHPSDFEEKNKGILNELPLVSPEKMYEAILDKYKNNVVVVDFWATWCSKLGIISIPAYIVYDRQGKQIDKSNRFPGVDKLRKSIEKGL